MMEYFTEEHSKLLLSREWLAKVDGDSSTAYLMKFHASFTDQTCVFMVTDTKSVWAEVLSTQRMVRRWHALNPSTSPADLPPPESYRERWTDAIVQCLSESHTPGGMDEMSLELTPSSYAEKSIVLGGDGFAWCWDACAVAPNLAAEVLSKHLILPLMSAAHLAFTTPEPLGSMTESALENAIDKVGRTARRGLDVHVKNVVARPRIASALGRFTALFDYSANTPRIVSEKDKPIIRLPSVPHDADVEMSAAHSPQLNTGRNLLAQIRELSPATNVESPTTQRSDFLLINKEQEAPTPNTDSVHRADTYSQPHAQPHSHSANAALSGSDTEPEIDEPEPAPASPANANSHRPTAEAALSSDSDPQPLLLAQAPAASPKPSSSRAPVARPLARRASSSSSDDGSAPSAKRNRPAPAPAKSKPLAKDDSSDSEGERRPAAGARRGTRQPVRRGGKRF